MSGPSQIERAALAYSAQLETTKHRANAMRRAVATVGSHTTKSGRPAARAVPPRLERVVAVHRRIDVLGPDLVMRSEFTVRLACGHYAASGGVVPPVEMRCPRRCGGARC